MKVDCEICCVPQESRGAGEAGRKWEWGGGGVGRNDHRSRGRARSPGNNQIDKSAAVTSPQWRRLGLNERRRVVRLVDNDWKYVQKELMAEPNRDSTTYSLTERGGRMAHSE